MSLFPFSVVSNLAFYRNQSWPTCPVRLIRTVSFLITFCVHNLSHCYTVQCVPSARNSWQSLVKGFQFHVRPTACLPKVWLIRLVPQRSPIRRQSRVFRPGNNSTTASVNLIAMLFRLNSTPDCVPDGELMREEVVTLPIRGCACGLSFWERDEYSCLVLRSTLYMVRCTWTLAWIWRIAFLFLPFSSFSSGMFLLWYFGNCTRPAICAKSSTAVLGRNFPTICTRCLIRLSFGVIGRLVWYLLPYQNM